MGKKSQTNGETSAQKNGSSEKASNGPSRTKSEVQVNSLEVACKGFIDILFDFPKGVLPVKLKYPINFQKGATALYVLILMSYFNNYSVGSYLYLGLHGTYGIIWLLKDAAFADQSFEAKAGFITVLSCVGVLAAYWVLGFIQVSGQGIDNPTPERIMCCIMLMALGSVIMMVADAQKTFTLKYKKGLINDGMFKYTRNPNYLGEMMIYGSFALATGHNTSWAILLTIWSLLFIPRMLAKEISYKTKAGAKEYLEQSSILLPKLFFRNTLLHYASWAAIAAGIYCIYQFGGLTALLQKIPKH